MSSIAKCSSQRTVALFTLKSSLPSTLLIKLYKRNLSGFFCGNRKNEGRWLSNRRYKMCYSILTQHIDVQEISFSSFKHLFLLENLPDRSFFKNLLKINRYFKEVFTMSLQCNVRTTSGNITFLVFDLRLIFKQSLTSLRKWSIGACLSKTI